MFLLLKKSYINGIPTLIPIVASNDKLLLIALKETLLEEINLYLLDLEKLKKCNDKSCDIKNFYLKKQEILYTYKNLSSYLPNSYISEEIKFEIEEIKLI